MNIYQNFFYHVYSKQVLKVPKPIILLQFEFDVCSTFGFHGNQAALAATRKRPHCSHISLMVFIFFMCSLLNHTNLLAENEHNLLHGFRDRTLATARQPQSVMSCDREQHPVTISYQIISLWT